MLLGQDVTAKRELVKLSSQSGRGKRIRQLPEENSVDQPDPQIVRGAAIRKTATGNLMWEFSFVRLVMFESAVAIHCECWDAVGSPADLLHDSRRGWFERQAVLS